jgi:hypothetical protein
MSEIPEGLCQCGCGERTTIWNRNRPEEGYVKGQPRRFRNGHQGRLRNFHIVDEETGCWNWQGPKDPAGYGVVSRNDVRRTAHGWYYEQAHGPIPDGLEAHHLCENKTCVNPDHITPVTHAENIRLSKRAKLTASQVAEIRSLAATMSRAALGRKFGVSAAQISRIVLGQRW